MCCSAKVASDPSLFPTISSEELSALPHFPLSPKATKLLTSSMAVARFDSNDSASSARPTSDGYIPSITDTSPPHQARIVDAEEAGSAASSEEMSSHPSPRRSMSVPVRYHAHTRSKLLSPLPFLLQEKGLFQQVCAIED